jgi:hypothetical protein
MTVLASPIAANSSIIPAAVGLVGVLVGVLASGAVSLLVAKQSREAAERAWIRDNGRDIWVRFLTCADRLLIACEAAWKSETEGAETSVETADAEFSKAYVGMQIFGDNTMVDRARIYAYRLLELKASLGSTSVMDRENFHKVASLIRVAREDMFDAIRAGLGVGSRVRPDVTYNPFAGTELEEKYADRARRWPGSAV